MFSFTTFLFITSAVLAIPVYPAIEEWFSYEWNEYVDISDYEWIDREWLLNVNSSSACQLSALPGLNPTLAVNILKERQRKGPFPSLDNLIDRLTLSEYEKAAVINSITTNPITPNKCRLHIKASRRWGENVNLDADRYNGSPIALTQRYRFSAKHWEMNLLTDKDSYESSPVDLWRLSLSWKSDRMTVIAGDFHVASGQGLSLWTQPVYSFNYDSPSHFRRMGHGIKPAVNQVQNSGLRGIAVNRRWNRLDIGLFASISVLDAIKDNNGNVLRLSDGGLHRSEAESLKKNTITEHLIGGAITCELPQTGNTHHSLYMSGYASEYSKPFRPVVSTRDRFPMQDSKFGSLGIGTVSTSGKFTLYWETAIDRMGHTAWIAGSRLPMPGFMRGSIDLMVYHYPKIFWNPRARSISSSVCPANSQVASILVMNRPESGFIKSWKALFEIENHPWRTWTIPSASRNCRCAVETVIRLSGESNLAARYRHRSDVDGNGEDGEVIDYIEDRFRLTFRNRMTSSILDEIRFWLEKAYYTENIFECNQGWLAGFKVDGSAVFEKHKRSRIHFDLSMCWFRSKGGFPIYFGEANLPDRIASVRLSGEGIRMSGALSLHGKKSCWLGVECARTMRIDNRDASGDFETYLTFSYRLDAVERFSKP